MVTILRCKRVSQNSLSGREELHRKQLRNTPIAACGLCDRKHQKLCGQAQIKSHGQTMWSRAENHTLFLPQQVLYCNSSSNGCQGPLKIKITTQNLIRSKQRQGDYGNFNRHGSRYIGTYVCKLKHGFANFEKIKRSLKKLSLNACNLSKKVIQ